MKNPSTIILFILVIITISCNQKELVPKFYKSFYTGEILNQTEFEEFCKKLNEKHNDSTKRFKMNFVFYKIDKSTDSIIYNFKYDIRVGTEYIVNSSKAKIFELVNNKFPIKTFQTINGESIQLGGISDKPTLLNFWYTHCPPCIAEMPALNKIKEKYEDRVNFISITWENKKDILKFLKKHEFNFSHIPDSKMFIEAIGSESYPQNIFIDKQGILQYIEGGMPHGGNGKEIESILDELL